MSLFSEYLITFYPIEKHVYTVYHIIDNNNENNVIWIKSLYE